MSEFDSIILTRRQEVIAAANERGAGDVSGAAGGTGGNNEEMAGAGGRASIPMRTASRDPNNMQTTGRRPDAEGDRRHGDFQDSGGGEVPADIPDASDDDIVARQLREAAMQEQDPELREKLWDEYRKYKGIQAKR